MARVFVALGSNLGDRARHLAGACAALDALPATVVLAASEVEPTVPLGGRDQPPFLNQMVALETSLTPHALLEACQQIERMAGRRRGSIRWADRTLDVDIVLYEKTVLDEPGLTLPHPGLTDRDFWQRELTELSTVLARRSPCT